MQKLTIILALSLLFMQCTDNNFVYPEVDHSTDIISIGDLDTNGQISSDAFVIHEAVRYQNKIKVEVSYSGGCKPHHFTLIWPEVITMIHPPQIPLWITHDNKGDTCTALVRDTLVFNISSNPLNLDMDMLNLAQIKIVNGSDEQQVIEVQ